MQINSIFDFKKFIIIFNFIVFLMLAGSAAVLSLAPISHIAIKTHWTFLWLNLETWKSIHPTFGTIFIILIAYHLFGKRKLLFNYLRPTSPKLNIELFVGLTLIVFIFAAVCLYSIFIAVSPLI